MSIEDFGKAISSIFPSFHDQLNKESDRGAVIVAAALIEDELQSLIKARLVSSLEKDDELFDTPYAPISTFAAKIDLAYRLGLITFEVRKTFHLLRKMRNDFAHLTSKIDFSDNSVKNRLRELFRINEQILGAMWSAIEGEKFASISKKAAELGESGKPIEAWIALVGARPSFDLFISLFLAFISLLPAQINPLKTFNYAIL